MKTILVLTDFSKSATNATNIAVNMAERLNANILLFHTYLSPTIVPSASPEIWSAKDFGPLKQESNAYLNKEAHRVQRMIEQAGKNLYKPTIYYMSAEGSLAGNVKSIIKEKDVLFIIMGGRKKEHDDFLAGCDTNAVVNKVDKPVFIIPQEHNMADIKNIVFATDVAKGDIKAIKWLLNLAPELKFRIHVGHVSRPMLVPDSKGENQVSDFTLAVDRLNSSSVNFHDLTGEYLIEELERFTEDTHADLLAMVHKKHSFIWRLFKNSPSKRLIARQKIPLLIMPEESGH